MDVLNVIIPAKNEEATIVETIENIIETFDDKIEYEVLVVNDYSEDNTERVLIDLSTKYNNLFYVNPCAYFLRMNLLKLYQYYKYDMYVETNL